MKNDVFLVEISKKIAEILGLNFQYNQFHDLERRLKLVANELSIDNSLFHLNDWFSKSSFSNNELKTLSTHLTVGETYFFREKVGLELFRHEILPELIKNRKGEGRQIRIWCAGCSSGEEPYTIAMIFKEYFPELSDWDITILATDISPNAIKKALQGEYTEWSFRDTEVALRNKYFLKSGKLWNILPEIKKMVTFSYLNLSQNSYPSTLTNTVDMDVIFCRNVLMYFTPGVINEVSNRFYNSITRNGWLITSQVELNSDYYSPFVSVQFNKGIFYRKLDKPKEDVKTPIIKSLDFIPVRHVKPIDNKGELKKSIKTISKKNVHGNNPCEKLPSDTSDPDAFFRTGHYLKCIECCQQMIAVGELDSKIFAFLVKSYANSGLLKEGKENINNIISKYSATTEMYYIYASFLLEQKDEEQSELMLKKAIYLNHRHILSHLMLGDIYLNGSRNQLAIRHYETVIRLLDELNDSDEVPESEGIMAGGIKALVISRINKL